jgi:hypothetical protein
LEDNMWTTVGKALVAIGVAIAGGEKYNGKKNPNWSNRGWYVRARHPTA